MATSLKRTLCSILIAAILTTGFGSYCFFTGFRYTKTFKEELMENFFGTLRNYPVWEFYSKVPSWYAPNDTKTDYDIAEILSSRVYYVSFIDHKRSTALRDEAYYFKVIGDISAGGVVSPFFDCGSELKIKPKYSDGSKCFYYDMTVMHAYYGAEFKEGEEYLISFIPTIEYIRGNTDYALFSEPYVFAPLDGECPYIEVYPGAVRYDATYFGAETKNVTKEEFIKLVCDYTVNAGKNVIY